MFFILIFPKTLPVMFFILIFLKTFPGMKMNELFFITFLNDGKVLVSPGGIKPDASHFLSECPNC